MEKIVVKGGVPLNGTVEISGMKNAALPIIFACVLVKDKCYIENVPNVRDVSFALDILRSLGASIKTINKTTLEIDCTDIECGDAPYELVSQMRASYYLLGAELGRFSYAKVALPGGCDFGPRPIDQHIKGFEALGGTVTNEGGYVEINAPDGIGGANIFFDRVTVGATANLMIAAAISDGVTVIDNAAREPHIVDLANFLNTMRADVRGAGTDVIKIRGVEHLHGCEYSIIPDQIEAGTYMVAAAATRGDVLIKNVIPKHLESISAKLIECGVTVTEYDDSVRVSCDRRPGKCNIKTMPHPGFPTDMQPQFAVLLCLADGTSIISESVWDNRFRYAEQLTRMGAKIHVDGKTAIIEGVPSLKGAPIRADDLRAGAAMMIAGMVATGVTEIEEIYHIERGYENVVEKFRSLGAVIERKTFPDEDKKSHKNAG